MFKQAVDPENNIGILYGRNLAPTEKKTHFIVSRYRVTMELSPYPNDIRVRLVYVIDLIVELLVLIIKPFHNQTES
jgi:hypothetical protein